MKIAVFAGLKDYFEPEFELAVPVRDTEELKASLLQLNKDAAGLLGVCRFAVGDKIIDETYKLAANDSIVIIPPSSGG